MTVHECWRAAQPAPAIPATAYLAAPNAAPAQEEGGQHFRVDASNGTGRWSQRYGKWEPAVRKQTVAIRPRMFPGGTTSCICSSLSSPWATTKTTSPKESPRASGRTTTSLYPPEVGTTSRDVVGARHRGVLLRCSFPSAKPAELPCVRRLAVAASLPRATGITRVSPVLDSLQILADEPPTHTSAGRNQATHSAGQWTPMFRGNQGGCGKRASGFHRQPRCREWAAAGLGCPALPVRALPSLR